MEFRNLEANEIECRIGTFSEKGISLLLYQDARAAMILLDATVGAENWQRKHEIINNNLFCSIGINMNYKHPEKEPFFVWKQDVGVESYTEKEKGQASDSFKRAAVNWGIGRELYTAPFIWINPDGFTTKMTKDGKKTTYDRFVVTHIGYDNDRNISSLSIYNTKLNKTVFTYGIDCSLETKKKDEPASKKESTGYPEREVMISLAKEKYPEGSKPLLSLLNCWRIEKLEEASTAQLMVIWNKYGGKNE